MSSPEVLIGPLSKYSKQPKTPLIAGIICGICIGTAWAISFGNYLLKKLRKRRRNRTRRLANASTTSGVPPNAGGTTRSRSSALPPPLNGSTFSPYLSQPVESPKEIPGPNSRPGSPPDGRYVQDGSGSHSQELDNVSTNSNTLHGPSLQVPNHPYPSQAQKSLPPTPTSTVPSPLKTRRDSTTAEPRSSWIPEYIWKRNTPQQQTPATRPTNDTYSLSSLKPVDDVGGNNPVRS